MGWLIAGGVVLLLLLLPLGVGIRYDEDGFRAKLIVGPVKVPLFPRKKRKKPKEKQKQKKPAKPSGTSEKSSEPERKKGGALTDFLPLVDTALDFLGAFRRKLRVTNLDLAVSLAGDDPCDLAVNYGRVQGIVSGLLPQLERCFVLRKKRIWIGCDFEAEQTRVRMKMHITMTLGRLLGLGIQYGIRFLRQHVRIRNKQKGGAKT